MIDKQEIVSGFVLELRRGTVVLCVLAKLREPAYGYSLISLLADSGVVVEANTLYPLLRRLEGQGLLSSAWDTQGAKPRKYYQTTAFGQEVLAELREQWRVAARSMDTILGENDHEK